MKHYQTKLLDTSHKLDVNLLDNFVNCLHHGEQPRIKVALLGCSILLHQPSKCWDYNKEQSRSANTVKGASRCVDKS